jgi:hypothetical protein
LYLGKKRNITWIEVHVFKIPLHWIESIACDLSYIIIMP